MLKKKYLSPKMKVYSMPNGVFMNAISTSGSADIFDIWG